MLLECSKKDETKIHQSQIELEEAIRFLCSLFVQFIYLYIRKKLNSKRSSVLPGLGGLFDASNLLFLIPTVFPGFDS